MEYTICTAIKNEHRYIKEWIDYHLSIGFNAIHLFEDYGSESHKEFLSEYDNVFIHSLKDCPRTDYKNGDYKQVDMMKYFIDTYCDKYDWVAFIDVDEYIRFEDGYDLVSLCNEFNSYDAIYLQWNIIGANGHIKRPEGRIQDNYFGCAEWDNPKYCFKSLCNLKHNPEISHCHKIKRGVFTNHKNTRRGPHKLKAYIDHYFTKSWEDWCERFTERGDVVEENRKLHEFFRYNSDLIGKCKIPNGTLVFDVGCNNGDDSEKYLNQLCNVVAIECSPKMCELLKTRFADENRFTLEEVCIGDSDGEDVSFYISSNDKWSSTHKEIASRVPRITEIRVKTITLQSLFDKYGTPYYCKIDIEGNDIVALRSIHTLPEYISCETECLGKDDIGNPFEVIDQLHKMGYTSFKLVDQKDGTVYANGCRQCSRAALPWHLPLGWDDYKTCRETLQVLRSKHTFKTNYDFWYDVYAKR